MDNVIILGADQFEVGPIPLGRIKKVQPLLNKIIPAFREFDSLTEPDFDNVIMCISLALNKPVAEIEQVPCSVEALADAIHVIVNVAGLKPKGEATGETQAVS